MRRQEKKVRTGAALLGSALIAVGLIILGRHTIPTLRPDAVVYTIGLIASIVLLIRDRRRHWWAGFIAIASTVLLLSVISGIDTVLVVVAMFLLCGAYLIAISLGFVVGQRKRIR